MIVEQAKDIFDKIKTKDYFELEDIAKKIEPSFHYEKDDWPKLYETWEKSVLRGEFDFSVYNHDAYLFESFICWKIYSRQYLIDLRKYLASSDCEIDRSKIHRILDLGCGCAYSTVGLKSIFDDACVMGTNLKGTLQFSIDEFVCENIDGCSMVDENDTFNLGNVDMVFASEFFEHIQEPIDFLLSLLRAYSPEYLVVANTFTRMSLGHFSEYFYNGEAFNGIRMSRMFNDTLRENGYISLSTGFWNNRPKVWKRGEVEDGLF